MRKLTLAALAAMLLAAAIPAHAKCPSEAPYNCVPDYNGKMRCGCGV